MTKVDAKQWKRQRIWEKSEFCHFVLSVRHCIWQMGSWITSLGFREECVGARHVITLS